MGLKTHAKTTLVVRQRGTRCGSTAMWARAITIRRRPGCTRTWASCRPGPSSGADVTRFFNYITGFSQPPHYQELVTSPGGSATGSSSCIDAEAKAGPDGRIAIKVTVSTMWP